MRILLALGVRLGLHGLDLRVLVVALVTSLVDGVLSNLRVSRHYEGSVQRVVLENVRKTASQFGEDAK